MKDLIIIGAGGYARELASLLSEINAAELKWNILGFLDDTVEPLKGKNTPYSVLGPIQGWNRFENVYFLMGIAGNEAKLKITTEFKEKGAKFISVIHPLASVSEFVTLGEGVVIYPQAVISPDVILGDYVTVLSGSYVGHDSVVGDYTMLSGLCGVNGYSNIGKRVYIGSRVIMVPHIHVGDDAYIGMGSVVIRNVKSGEHVFGNPAKKMP